MLKDSAGGFEEESLIPRNRLFVLLDGTFVVRWDENEVQDLETGHYRPYEKRDFGALLTDYELNQLKSAGLVLNYDKEKVWLCPLPERVNSALATWEMRRARSYYLNTTLPGSMAEDIDDLIDYLGLHERFEVRVRDDFVVLWSTRGASFQKFDDAEKARYLLTSKMPEVFMNTVIAFIETTRRD